MIAPGRHDERTALVGYIEAQLEAIRASAYGLTEEQARATPCRSELSIGGLLKHAAYVCDGRARREADLAGEHTLDREGIALFLGSFALADDETLESTLHAFDASVSRYLARLREVDPGAATTEPPAPWDGRPEPTASVERFYLIHQIEELARHAGHADIIREQLDGADATSLHLAASDLPGNDFVTPWTPPPRP